MPESNATTEAFDHLIRGGAGVVNAVVANESMVCIGGEFDGVGDTLVNNVACWDGTVWHALGGGVEGTVHALAFKGTDLYVGGAFLRAGNVNASNIARWDGSQWYSLDTGTDSGVYTLLVDGESLFVGGVFGRVGGVVARKIARWDGEEWYSLDSGIHGDVVYALAKYGQYVYACGRFEYSGEVPAYGFARWNGSSWVSIGWGVAGEFCRALNVYNNELYVGGFFHSVGDKNSLSSVNNIVRWDGEEWTDIGGVNWEVTSFAVYQDKLIVVGNFTEAGGIAASRVAQWDGAAWSPMFTGFDNRVSSVSSFGDQLYVGGRFNTGGGAVRWGLARWSNGQWGRVGSTVNRPGVWARGQVYSMLIHDNALYVGGDFSHIGNQRVNNIARWDGMQWHALGNGTSGPVRTMASSGTSLYVGGYILGPNGYSAGPGSVPVSRWDGFDWYILFGDAISHSLAFFNEHIYLGFNYAWSSQVMRWNWNGQDTEIILSRSTPGFVNSMVAWNGFLYMGGGFEGFTNYNAISRVARWDGERLSALGEGLNDVVNVLLPAQNSLYAGGAFSASGGTLASRVARWDGSEWQPVGAGANGEVRAMAASGNRLFIGGDFTRAGSETAYRVAQWDGTRWSPLGSGVNGSVHAMVALGNEVFVGGTFSQAGGQLAYGLARWDGTQWSRNLGPLNIGALPSDPPPPAPPVTSPATSTSSIKWLPNGSILASKNVDSTLYVGGTFTRLEAHTGSVVLFSGLDNSSTSVIAAPFNETAFSARAATVLGDTLLLGGQAGLRLVLASNDTLAVSPLNLPGEVYALHVRGSHVFVGGEGFVCRIPRSSLAVGAAGRCQLLGTVRGTVFALHHDGAHLYVGGEFTSWNSLGEQAELTNLARVSGLIVDTEWRPLLNGAVHAIASYDGRLVVGGAFTTVGTITRNRLLAFDLATDALLSWNPNVSGPVFTLALDPGFLYVGGSFTTIGGGSRSSVARFSRTTHELNAWSVTLSGQQTGGAVPVVVRTILPRTSDVLLGGTFTQVGGQARRNVAAVALANGAVQAWRPVPNGDVSVLVARGTDVVMAGSFTIGAGIEQANLAAFTLTGASGFTPVSAFVPVVNGTVRALSYCSGTLYAGGDFREAGGLVRDRLAGFHASTGAVSTWNPAASATVQALDCSGTTLFAGGAFTQIDGNTRNRVASFDLSTNGALTTWAPVVNNTVNAIEVAGNTVYLGGQFTQVGGASRNRLASVGAQSGMVTLWNPNVNGTVHALAVDHRNVYAAGEFTQVGTLTRDRLVQVDPAGLATSWNPSANGTVRALLYDAGVLYAGGEFTSVSGAPQTGLAAFATRGSLSGTLLTPGGTVQTVVRAGANVVIGGNFTSGVSRGTALTASGSDPSERVYLHVREGSQSVGLQVATDANVSNHTTGQNLPPVPPAGIFDVRLLTSTTTASHTWIAAIDSFPLQIQRSVSSTPVQVGFVLPPNALGVLYNGTAVVATLSGREVVELNIPGTTWNLGLELFMDGAEISHAYGTLPSREWRMLSLPFTPANGNSSDVFSPATDVFGFETGYAKVTSLEALRGYWVYVDSSSARVVGTLSGLPPAVQEIRVREGWNLIGSFSTAVARTGLSTVPRTLITGSVFGRSDGGTYEPVTELLPGRAYWLRASAAGVIRPGVATFAPALRAQEPELLPFVRVTDASGRSGQVYRAPDAATVQNYLLPPLPPPPSFDLRLANGSLATTFSAGEAQVLVQGGTYPLRVEAVPGAPYMEVVSANGTVLGFLGERPVVVTEPGGFTLRAAVPEVPEALEVRALYPQPASREVTLQIGLPEAGFATVTVFNLIGQEVMRVELAEREAGFARETLRVDDLPAGMYVLRIHTDRESQTRSLVIAR